MLLVFVVFSLPLHVSNISLLFRTNNPVLLHLLLFLSNCLHEPVNYNLLLDIVSKGGDLLLPFVKSLTFSLEPQPTSKWVREVSFLTQVSELLPFQSLVMCDAFFLVLFVCFCYLCQDVSKLSQSGQFARHSDSQSARYWACGCGCCMDSPTHRDKTSLQPRAPGKE